MTIKIAHTFIWQQLGAINHTFASTYSVTEASWSSIFLLIFVKMQQRGNAFISS